MWLAVTVYTDGLDICYGKFKTKKEAITYLEDLGFEKKEQQFGRKIGFHAYGSYAEVVPMDEFNVGEIR